MAAAGAAGLAAGGARATAPSRSHGTEIDFPSPVGAVHAYLATPTGRGRHPAILVLHAQLGLPAWARAAADELAAAGFVALALFGFSRSPGLTEEQLRADGRGARNFLSESYFREGQQELHGAVDYLHRLPAVRRGPLGAVGFCGGGIRGVRFAIASPAIGAVVSFYGPPALPAPYRNAADPMPDLVDVAAQLRAPLQIHYGTADYVVHAADVARLAEIVRAAGTPVEVHAYEGATHAFYGSADPAANAAATAAARPRYLAFLHARLG
ncbi:MAG: dienelactone hydrolase family protein [Sphingomonadaceae bacterium]|nr:dienelactone hydrolase family protein [Sphingomonadaceae bacterium]